VQASANVDAIVLQLLLRRENEGRQLIIIEATERLTMTEEEDQMMAQRAEPARRRWLLMRGNATTALGANKRGWFGDGGQHMTT
jgi:hypothetical protein